MKIRHPLLTKLAGLGITSAIKMWMRTLDCRCAAYDPALDPASPDCHERNIYLLWHEYIMLPTYLRGRCNMSMLMSRHGDADLLSRVALHQGFGFVRGSTARGGEQAIRQLMHRGNSQHLIITPDGPRGPRRTFAAGSIYLASKTQMPLVLLAFGYNSAWRAPSWDQFAVPRAFSRARIVISPQIRIPAKLDRDGIEHYRLRTEKLLNHLTLEAEAWAVSGDRKIGERSFSPATAHLGSPPRSILGIAPESSVLTAPPAPLDRQAA